MIKESINPDTVAKPGGYTHVVKLTEFDNLVFISGQVARGVEGNLVGKNDVEKQLRQVFDNLRNALASVGATFENFKVSESSFTPTASIFFGDYTNIAAWEGKIYPIWTRLHNGIRSTWIALVSDSVRRLI